MLPHSSCTVSCSCSLHLPITTCHGILTQLLCSFFLLSHLNHNTSPFFHFCHHITITLHFLHVPVFTTWQLLLSIFLLPSQQSILLSPMFLLQLHASHCCSFPSSCCHYIPVTVAPLHLPLVTTPSHCYPFPSSYSHILHSRSAPCSSSINSCHFISITKCSIFHYIMITFYFSIFLSSPLLHNCCAT